MRGWIARLFRPGSVTVDGRQGASFLVASVRSKCALSARFQSGQANAFHLGGRSEATHCLADRRSGLRSLATSTLSGSSSSAAGRPEAPQSNTPSSETARIATTIRPVWGAMGTVRGDRLRLCGEGIGAERRNAKGHPRRVAPRCLAPRPGLEPGTCGLMTRCLLLAAAGEGESG